MIPCSPTFINNSYFDNLLAEFDDSIFKEVSNNTILDLGPTPKTQELFSKSMKRNSPEVNADFQTLAKKARIEPSPPLTSEVGKTKTQISPELGPIIVGSINRILSRTNESLEGIQTYYAKVLKVDLQDVKNIYSAVSTNCSTVEKTSAIKITPLKKLSPLYLDLTSPLQTTMIIISPESKRILADNINQIFQRANVSLEQIQTSYAKEFKVGLQDIKDICFAVSNNYPTANEPSEIKQIGLL